MICAYDKLYLENAMRVLARMYDFAVYDLKFSMEEFTDFFIITGVADRFGKGDITLTVGKSGVEVAYEILRLSGLAGKMAKPVFSMERTPEYWTGWALAYYQWKSARSFRDILDTVGISEILGMYDPYHEMDISAFADRMEELYISRHPENRLRVQRIRMGYSQSALADMTGIPLRTIQQYEQGQKDINKANVSYLVNLSSVLLCDIRDLLQPKNAF